MASKGLSQVLSYLYFFDYFVSTTSMDVSFENNDTVFLMFYVRIDDGQWIYSAVEMCCPTCRLRRTPCFAPCFKLETTCTLVDFKCVIPCDRDQPLEIALCGWNCYTKREVLNTTGKIFLQIKTIKVHDMKGVDFMTKNDLYCKVYYGDKIKYRTITMDNAGAQASWELQERAADTFDSINVQKHHRLLVEVFDANTMRADTLIGTSAKINLAKVMETPGEERNFPFKVFNDKGVPTGNVLITAVASPIISSKDGKGANRIMRGTVNTKTMELSTGLAGEIADR